MATRKTRRTRPSRPVIHGILVLSGTDLSPVVTIFQDWPTPLSCPIRPGRGTGEATRCGGCSFCRWSPPWWRALGFGSGKAICFTPQADPDRIAALTTRAAGDQRGVNAGRGNARRGGDQRTRRLVGRGVIVPADGRSEPDVFRSEADRLIRDQHVSVIFGCWTSSCRKAVVPVVEREHNLLIYPVAYEELKKASTSSTQVPRRISK